MEKFIKITNVVDWCKLMGFDLNQYKNCVCDIGDITAIRYDKKNKPFRRNFERCLVVMSVIKKFNSSNMLEFGTGRGFVTCCSSIMESIQKIITIDIEKTDFIKGFVNQCLHENKYGINIDKISFVCKNSTKMNIDEIQGKFDIVFIDGEHSEEAVRNDFGLSLQCTTDNAVIVFDDYRNKHKGVKIFIDSLKYDKVLVSSDGWVFENRMLSKHGDADLLIDGKEHKSGQVVLFKGGHGIV